MKKPMKHRVFASIVVGAGMLATTPAFATYMSECDELIAAWEACRATGVSRCSAEEQRIIDECRCHEKRRDEWVFVRGSLSSGVCLATDPPTIIVPPPPPPPPTIIREETEERGGGDGHGDGDGRRPGG